MRQNIRKKHPVSPMGQGSSQGKGGRHQLSCLSQAGRDDSSSSMSSALEQRYLVPSSSAQPHPPIVATRSAQDRPTGWQHQKQQANWAGLE